MKQAVLNAYHRLPGPARSLFATLRGYQLRGWRYGPETDRLVEEALAREHWTDAQWTQYQQERLSLILEPAATQVPYYREQWQRRRRSGDRASWHYLENWPILEKDALRKVPQAFLAEDVNPRRMFHLHTSGTTGTPLSLWRSRATLVNWYALFEARWRRWYGVSRHDRWAILGGQLVTPVAQRDPPFWVWNGALNQLYMSSYHLAPDLIPHYLEALQRYRIRYLWGYSSSLYSLAQAALEQGWTGWSPVVAIANAEPLYAHQREIIEAAFGCPVRETYGMAEMVAAASECEHRRLHLWPDAGILEVVERDQVIPNGMTGDLVCTGLLDADMPIIRYRIGDRGRLSERSSCACGRTLPLVESIEGRTDDVLYTVDGRPVGRLDPIFKAELPIREAQIVQETLERVRLRYVPLPGFTQAVTDELARQLRARMGPVHIEFDQVSEIPRTGRGKFQAVVCDLSAEERICVNNP